jgi:hypothetical protein
VRHGRLSCNASDSSSGRVAWPATTAGGLPPGWLGTNKVFTRIEYIDLSGNWLGHSAYPATSGNRFSNTYGPDPVIPWCLAGNTPAAGWCPRTPQNVAVAPLAGLPTLVFLDLSGNGLQGMHLGRQPTAYMARCTLLRRPCRQLLRVGACASRCCRALLLHSFSQ